jgi:hypothetical protein
MLKDQVQMVMTPGSHDATSPANTRSPQSDGRGRLRPIEEMTPAEAREQMEATARARKAEPIRIAKIEERLVPGPGGAIRLRLY